MLCNFAVWSPIRKIFSKPLRATWMIFKSGTVKSSHRGGIQPYKMRKKDSSNSTRSVNRTADSRTNVQTWLTRYLMWSTVPPEVAFVIAHAASLRVLNSAFINISINRGKILALMTACKEPNNTEWAGDLWNRFLAVNPRYLNLILIPCCNVRNSPTSLLPDWFLRRC